MSEQEDRLGQVDRDLMGALSNLEAMMLRYPSQKNPSELAKFALLRTSTVLLHTVISMLRDSNRME